MPSWSLAFPGFALTLVYFVYFVVNYLSQNRLDHLAVDIGQAVVTALEFEGQFRVIDAEAMEDGGVEVMDVYRVAGDVVGEVIGGAVGHSRLNASSGHPDSEASWVMVSTIVIFGQFALTVGGSSKFAAPDDERLVE